LDWAADSDEAVRRSVDFVVGVVAFGGFITVTLVISGLRLGLGFALISVVFCSENMSFVRFSIYAIVDFDGSWGKGKALFGLIVYETSLIRFLYRVELLRISL